MYLDLARVLTPINTYQTTIQMALICSARLTYLNVGSVLFTHYRDQKHSPLAVLVESQCTDGGQTHGCGGEWGKHNHMPVEVSITEVLFVGRAIAEGEGNKNINHTYTHTH